MDYWKRIGCAAVMASTAGCAVPSHPHVGVGVNAGVPGRAGTMYNDIYNFKPLDFEAFSNAGEIEEAIEAMRRRIFFAAGPDKAEKIMMECETGSGKILCPVNETQRVLQSVNVFSDAVANCSTGSILSDGRPDPGSQVQLDLDCFVNTLKAMEPAKGLKGGNPGMQCQKALYECYKTGYAGIVKT